MLQAGVTWPTDMTLTYILKQSHLWETADLSLSYPIFTCLFCFKLFSLQLWPVVILWHKLCSCLTLVIVASCLCFLTEVYIYYSLSYRDTSWWESVVTGAGHCSKAPIKCTCMCKHNNSISIFISSLGISLSFTVSKASALWWLYFLPKSWHTDHTLIIFWIFGPQGLWLPVWTWRWVYIFYAGTVVLLHGHVVSNTLVPERAQNGSSHLDADFFTGEACYWKLRLPESRTYAKDNGNTRSSSSSSMNIWKQRLTGQRTRKILVLTPVVLLSSLAWAIRKGKQLQI